MTRHDGRIEIRGLMLATAVVAVLLLLIAFAPALAILVVPAALLAWIAGRVPPAWARRSFWGGAITLNFGTVPGTLNPSFPIVILLGFAWLVCLPAALVLLRRGWGAERPWTLGGATTSALACIGPVFTLWTFWPLFLATLVLQALLERLADRIAAGEPVAFPVRVGLFRFEGARTDPEHRVVVLLTDANPGWPCGLVRSPIGECSCYAGIRADLLHVDLGGEWCFHHQD